MKKTIGCILILLLLSGCFLFKKENETANNSSNVQENVPQITASTAEEKKDDSKTDELPVVDSNGNSVEIEAGTVSNIPDSASVSASDFSSNTGNGQNSNDNSQDTNDTEETHTSGPNELPIIEYHN